MAARHEPVGALATSCAPPTNPVDDHQAVSTPVDQGYQELSSNSGVPTRTARPEEPRSSTWMQQLGGLVQSCVGYVQQFFRQFIQPARLAGSGPKECITNIDPNTQQIVSNEFIEQVSRDHAELFNLRNERDKIRERWQAAVSELNDLKPSEQIFVVDDAEMTGKWKQLQYSIKNFARSHLWEPISSEKLIIQQRECLELITPRYQELLSSEKHVHLLFQSFIWLNIMNLTLADTTLMWGKQVAEAYRGLAKYRPGTFCTRHVHRTH
ncbi:hypothetical protein F4802DRAFT_549262 [Xylaria palmicola]|nr:hypothetical protein F4802DRAFT_549262 [Xylaria palmicola]